MYRCQVGGGGNYGDEAKHWSAVVSSAPLHLSVLSGGKSAQMATQMVGECCLVVCVPVIALMESLHLALCFCEGFKLNLRDNVRTPIWVIITNDQRS